MQSVASILTDGPRPTHIPRFPLHTTESYLQALRRTADRAASGSSPTDGLLAESILLFVDGRFVEAEEAVLAVVRDSVSLYERDPEAFISVLYALFAIQRLDLIAALLRDRHGFAGNFELSFEEGTVGAGCVRWDISATQEHRLVFDTASLREENARLEILAFHWIFPLLAHYAAQPVQEFGSVFLNRADIGLRPGLAYCDSRPEYFLIPDCIFVPTRGYEYARGVFKDKFISWEDRAEVAFWRGATTGVPASPGEWRSLERIKLCELAQRHAHPELLDVGISSVVQLPDREADEVRHSGLIRSPVPWQEWGRFRYLIDIDGNSSPWSNLLQRLMTGSPVLKVESKRGLQQWFYDELLPWQNYVPIAPDMSDLIDKMNWLRRNDSIAQTIGRNGQKLAVKMSYERELRLSVPVISAALRYFRGNRIDVTPFGRAARKPD